MYMRHIGIFGFWGSGQNIGAPAPGPSGAAAHKRIAPIAQRRRRVSHARRRHGWLLPILVELGRRIGG